MRRKSLPCSVQGFTLVEMAVVLVIVGLVLGGLLLPLSAQLDQRNLSEGRKQIEEIKEALIGYALINGQLPCPADPAKATGTAGAGVVDCAFSPAGVVPWVTLGLKETDPWGRRFAYRVTSLFADNIAANTYGCVPAVPPASSSFALCSVGDMTVLNAAGGVNVALNVSAVVISYGKNGFGGYLPSGAQVAASANADEQENTLANTTFVDKTIDAVYDDLTAWVSSPILFNRIIAAGKLP